MKILQINASYKPAYIYGGPTMSVAKLSEQLTAAGHKVTVFTTTANGDIELLVTPNTPIVVEDVTVLYFTRITKDHSHLSPALLRKLWCEVTKFDVVHIHAWWNLVSVFSALIATLKKVPVLISPRGTLSAYSFNNKNSLAKSMLHNLIGKSLLKRSYLHATSSAEKNALFSIIKPKEIFNIPNFVKIGQSPPPKKIVGPVLKLLFFSRIEEKKGLDILLRALPLINIPYHLTVAGDGDENYIKTLKNISINNSTAQHVSWIGFQDKTKFDIYASHDLMVLCSHNENFGNVIIESLSSGTAVVISKHVGLAEYVDKNELGWVCETEPSSISNIINTIAAHHIDKLAAIRLNAPAIIHRDFDDKHLIHKYISMYQQITTNGRL